MFREHALGPEPRVEELGSAPIRDIRGWKKQKAESRNPNRVDRFGLSAFIRVIRG
jgi:hypothetical protein